MARGRRQLARAASNCGAIATLSAFLNDAILRGELLGRIPTYSNEWGLIMTIGSALSTEQTRRIKEVFATNDVRALVAHHLGVNIARVTEEAHFTDNVGADWLDLRAMKPTKQQDGCEQVAPFFLRLGGDAMRNLIGWCPETRQPIDLQFYVDDATLARIWSNAVRFRCPHCGVKHETKVERLASRPLSLEPPQTKRMCAAVYGGCDAVLSLRS
jgi:hypothetical protein